MKARNSNEEDARSFADASTVVVQNRSFQAKVNRTSARNIPKMDEENVNNSVHDRSDKGKKKVRVGDISEEYTKEELEIARSLKERKQNESMRREQIMKHELMMNNTNGTHNLSSVSEGQVLVEEDKNEQKLNDLLNFPEPMNKYSSTAIASDDEPPIKESYVTLCRTKVTVKKNRLIILISLFLVALIAIVLVEGLLFQLHYHPKNVEIKIVF